jgi:DNA-binding HxlR family transcriptional regulator
MARERERSALADAVERVGDRWTLLLVHVLLGGPGRYGELQTALPGISPNILAARLKQLEGEGLVLATPYQDRPPRFTYELTDRGRELADVLSLLAQWGDGGTGEREDALRHDPCGTPVVTRLWCPTCDRAVDDETSDLDWL